MRILVVEDDRDLNRLISDTLKKEHYTIDSCFDGEEAEDYIRCAQYDVILLDIMMPKVSGLEVLRQMRNAKDRTPVLLLTAKDSVEDRVEGLDCGADDYLVKPFSFEELTARIRVMIRRASQVTTDDKFTLADLTLDCTKRSVVRGDTPIELSAKEFDILEYMIRNSGKVLSRDKISNHIWNYEYEGGSNVVDVYIRYLRKKIDDDFKNKLIHTVRGVGYVLRSDK